MPHPTKKLEAIVDFQNGLWTGKKAPFVTAKVLRNTNFKNNDGSLNYDDVAEIEVEEKQLESRLLQKGDIILERSGGGPDQPVGRVVYFKNEDGKFSFSNFTTRIRVGSNKIDDKYLWFFLHSFYRSGKTELMQKKTTGIRNLTFSEYKQIEIPLPPLSEQKKIVAKLEGVLAKISEAKKLRAEAQENADNLLPAELHKIFSTQHSHILKNVRMSASGKKKWEEKTVEEVTELVTKGTTPKTLGHAYTESGVPFLKAENVNGGVIDASSMQTFISKQTHDILSRSKTKNGDVLMTIAGTIGRLGWIPEHAPEMNMNQAVAIIRPRRNLIASPYLVYILSAGISQSQVNSGIVKAAIPNFSLGMIKKIKIQFPPLAEQKKIVKHLDSLSQKLQKLQEYQKSTQSNLLTLERAILQKAFL